jgi:glycosyltransferase involved in cell wall biosynthesis
MIIAYEVQPIVKKKLTGIAYSEYYSISALLKKYPSLALRFDYFDSGLVNTQRLLDISTENTKIQKVKGHPFVYRTIGHLLHIPYSFLFGKKAQITHFFNFFIPPGVSGKKVATIHDMTFYAYPETMAFRTKMMFKLHIKDTCRRADRIITDSYFSKREIMKYLNVEDNKISVIHLGVDLEKFHPLDNGAVIDSVRRKYNLPAEYFLYMGTLEPRKNITRLIYAYSLLRKKNTNTPKLVLAGGKGWLHNAIFEIVNKENLKDDVVFIGYVSDGDIVPLLNGAALFLFPSLYEGFGLPPLEAMACGVPVVTSQAASLPEVVGDAALIADPFSIEDIAEKIDAVYSSAEVKNRLIQKGLERAKLFTWEKAADKLMKVYEEVVGT